MNQPGPIEEFTVCFPNPTGDPAEPTELRVRGTVDQVAKTITFELPNGARTQSSHRRQSSIRAEWIRSPRSTRPAAPASAHTRRAIAGFEERRRS